MKFPTFLSLVLLAGSLTASAQQLVHMEFDSPFGSFVEEDFPFFCQTLDAREFGDAPEPKNLTPRGIITKLGGDCYGCFDPDLLRWALVWKANEKGEYLTMDGMAPGSYRFPNRKAPAGQESLPKPIGTPLLQSALFPGWCVGENPSREDPRDTGSSDEGEVGLGPIPAELGRFSGIRLPKHETETLRLEYTIGSTSVTEAVSHGGEHVGARRSILVEPHQACFWLYVDDLKKSNIALLTGSKRTEEFTIHDGWLKLPPTPQAQHVIIQFEKPVDDSSGAVITESALPEPTKRWPETVTTKLPQGPSDGPFTFDDIPLPVPNPWKRNVRVGGLDFFPDGRAALCTFDGDVWMVGGIEEGSREATWSRFASGLHEPKTVCIVENGIYVSDRNGIVRLVDTDGNGEADWYENFSNTVPQTAETREFAMDMVAAKDGGFFLAKGGQVGSTRGMANGTIVKVSPDGKSHEIIASGLRQPYIGYDPETGILTSSDQQGHWKPATPIYRIEPGKYYGFQPAKLKDKAVHPASISPPEIWIPHFINQSGASQVWMKNGAKMGALDGELVHIGFNRPEIFRVYLSDDRNQGAVVPILSGFPSGLLKGNINPADGRLYVAGFEIWGTSGERISSLSRIRPTGKKSWIPRKVVAGKRGVLLSFDQAISPELALEVVRYSIDRWNYRQTHNYGSGNFRLDGEPGQESVGVSSVKVASNAKSIFIGLPGMAPSHSLRVTYRLPIPDSMQVDSAYLTISKLEKLDLPALGFADDEVDLTPPRNLTGTTEKIKPTAAIGKEVAIRYGCVACHATGDSSIPAPPPVTAAAGAQLVVGPPWTGLWKSRRTFTDKSFIKAVDETYLRESILDPGRRVAEGFETEKTGVGMPSYLGVLKDHEIDSIILFIQTLQKKK